MYRVVFYCPDTNFMYDGHTPDRVGIGGGKTALIRMAWALRAAGHQVTVYGNCRPGEYDDVHYQHYSRFQGLRCDVLVVTTSSKLDLSDWEPRAVATQLTILWVHGASPIEGLERVSYDFIYAVSDYLRQRLIEDWGLPEERVLRTHNGFYAENLAAGAWIHQRRDPHAIIFTSHPSKGLERTVAIVQALRQRDARFHLDIYGGERLWYANAEENGTRWQTEGIDYRGLVNQRELARQYYRYGFLLALSDVPDTSSIALWEAKKAGVIVIASAVGGNPEIIRHGYDGFLIEVDYLSAACHKQCLELLVKLTQDEAWAEVIRAQAMAEQRSWQVVAGEWLAHWQRVLA